MCYKLRKSVESLKSVKGHKRLTLSYLAGCANAKNNYSCWPSVKTISEGIACSRATVFRSLEFLEKAGYITKENRINNKGQTSNKYNLNIKLINGIFEDDLTDISEETLNSNLLKCDRGESQFEIPGVSNCDTNEPVIEPIIMNLQNNLNILGSHKDKSWETNNTLQMESPIKERGTGQPSSSVEIVVAEKVTQHVPAHYQAKSPAVQAKNLSSPTINHMVRFGQIVEEDEEMMSFIAEYPYQGTSPDELRDDWRTATGECEGWRILEALRAQILVQKKIRSRNGGIPYWKSPSNWLKLKKWNGHIMTDEQIDLNYPVSTGSLTVRDAKMKEDISDMSEKDKRKAWRESFEK